jgi:hypothetical protein
VCGIVDLAAILDVAALLEIASADIQRQALSIRGFARRSWPEMDLP